MSHTIGEKLIFANQYLIEILLNNLISNAIRHNYVGGEVKVILNQEKLLISNTGTNSKLLADDIFKRFYKSSASEGSGLGLTISRQICENLDFYLDYNYSDPYNSFIVSFNS
ncbi:ATP-binding protein [Mucilaginibacter sp.]